MSEQSIRQHLRAALDAIVSRERERERAADAGGAGVLASARIRTMRPLVEALSAVAGETWARRTSCAISAASASVSPSTKVAAGRISSSSRVRPNLGSRPFTSA